MSGDVSKGEIEKTDLEVMDIQGHTPFKARGGLGVAGYGLDMV